ncbi:MAG TPA: hypothetical protein VM491_21150 [Burkholderiaceae bacterium]|nr:hypothetical protein [Burkholderiaceae bacterium]
MRSGAGWALTGVALLAAGFVLLLAMVVRVVEPGLALSLLGYVAMFGGTMMAIAGTIALLRTRV